MALCLNAVCQPLHCVFIGLASGIQLLPASCSLLTHQKCYLTEFARNLLFCSAIRRLDDLPRMKKALLIYGILACVLILGCKEKQYLTGYYNYASFQKDCHWEQFSDPKYKPSEKWLDSLQTIHLKDSVRIELFLGCYCGDSKKWVPRFFDLKKQLPIAAVDIVSLDTTKKDEKNLAPMAGIKKIPTFIFYQGSNEVGRIVEKPKGGLEKNIFLLLKKCE
jgi:Thioredoxin